MPDNDNIVFSGIPVTVRTPGQYIEISNLKQKGLPGQVRKVLVLGQRLSTGSVAEEIPKPVTNWAQGVDYFGRGSNLAVMLKALFDTAPNLTVVAVAADDLAGGVADIRTLTLTGAATAAGTLALYIGGEKVSAAVGSGDSVTTAAAALTAAINAKADLMFTAAASAGVITITCRHKGEIGKDVDFRLNMYPEDETPAGLAGAIVHTTPGSGNPDVADLIAAISDDQYVTIVSPWSDAANMVKLETELSSRFGPLTQKTGHVFTAISGTHAAMTTWGAARNSAHVSAWGLKGSPTPDYIRAAIWAGVVETEGAKDPARPFQTLSLPGVLAPDEADRLTRAERDLLLHGGVSTSCETAAGNVAIERVITTYQTNASGIDDESYLDLNTKWTVDYIRHAMRARIASRYPRHKLADDGTQAGPGQAVVTPKLLKAEVLALFVELEKAGLVENLDQFRDDLEVARSTSDTSRVNAVIPTDTINQFRVFAAAVQFQL